MNRIDLAAIVRQVKATAQYNEREAINILCELIKELNSEIEELKRRK